MQPHNNTSKISKARAGLVLDQPFFGALALRLGLREDPAAPTAWTDGQTLGYNPDFIEGLSLEEVKGLLAHEVMHVACAHHARRQEREPRKWNMAGDYAVNDLLLASGFKLPAGGLTGYGADESAESIYNKLPDPPPSGGQGNGQGEGNGNSDPGGCGEVRDAPAPDGGNPSPGDLARAEADAKVAVAQAAQAAKACGKLPAGLARLVEELLEPHVPWREVLRRFIDQAARNDYTWTRPSRRYLASGMYLPALYSEEMRPVAVAIDTSGSINQGELSQFAAELSAILAETRAAATVIYCDSEVSGVEEFDTDALPLDLHPKGGGGTDFRPPFAEVDRRALQPSCLIYLTDGECASFPEAPEYPVLWAITSKRKFSPPFGEVVEVTP
jgi:predicted metal-dependent peptidase